MLVLKRLCIQIKKIKMVFNFKARVYLYLFCVYVLNKPISLSTLVMDYDNLY